MAKRTHLKLRLSDVPQQYGRPQHQRPHPVPRHALGHRRLLQLRTRWVCRLKPYNRLYVHSESSLPHFCRFGVKLCHPGDSQKSGEEKLVYWGGGGCADSSMVVLGLDLEVCGVGRVPTVMENARKSWNLKPSWKVMEKSWIFVFFQEVMENLCLKERSWKSHGILHKLSVHTFLHALSCMYYDVCLVMVVAVRGGHVYLSKKF